MRRSNSPPLPRIDLPSYCISPIGSDVEDHAISDLVGVKRNNQNVRTEEDLLRANGSHLYQQEDHILRLKKESELKDKQTIQKQNQTIEPENVYANRVSSIRMRRELKSQISVGSNSIPKSDHSSTIKSCNS